jgi:uncharacterized protein YqeY
MESTEIESYIDQAVAKTRQESAEQMQLYIGALKEDMDHRMDAIKEYVKDVPASIEKQNEMSEKLDQLTTDDEFLKVIAKDHEQRIQKLEA